MISDSSKNSIVYNFVSYNPLFVCIAMNNNRFQYRENGGEMLYEEYFYDRISEFKNLAPLRYHKLTVVKTINGLINKVNNIKYGKRGRSRAITLAVEREFARQKTIIDAKNSKYSRKKWYQSLTNATPKPFCDAISRAQALVQVCVRSDRLTKQRAARLRADIRLTEQNKQFFGTVQLPLMQLHLSDLHYCMEDQRS